MKVTAVTKSSLVYEREARKSPDYAFRNKYNFKKKDVVGVSFQKIFGDLLFGKNN